ASLPTNAWKWGVFSDRLYGVPWPTDPLSEWIFYRKDLFDKHGWGLPTTAEELFELGEEINDPRNNRWAFGDFYRVARQSFRAPREWRYEDGKLVHRYETPEFEEAVAFMRRVYDAGLVHPDIAAGTGANSKELFIKKGLGEEKVTEILAVLNYCAAPFGTVEYMAYRYGEEGTHHELNDDGAPELTELGHKEVSNGYLFISGRNNAIAESEYPDYVESF